MYKQPTEQDLTLIAGIETGQFYFWIEEDRFQQNVYAVVRVEEVDEDEITLRFFMDEGKIQKYTRKFLMEFLAARGYYGTHFKLKHISAEEARTRLQNEVIELEKEVHSQTEDLQNKMRVAANASKQLQAFAEHL